jgi:diacylglycerol kinase family enzyme
MLGVRALLVANARAASVTPRTLSVIEHALASEMDLTVDVQTTKRRGHATHLTRGAVHEGLDMVISLGGDGTVNEIANGLAGSTVPLAIIPGGGTNVLARSLGIPRDPIDATAHLLANYQRPPRRVPLGRAAGRYFTFTCGMGIDGAIVRDVERRQLLKKTVGHGFYVWSSLRLFFAGVDRRRPQISVRWGPSLEHHRDGLFLAISQKTRPFSYLGNREMHICPHAELEKGLDLFGIDRFGVPTVLRVAAQTLTTARHLKNKHVLYLHDQGRIQVRAARPLPVQMDGEYLGDREVLELEAVPEALSIVY